MKKILIARNGKRGIIVALSIFLVFLAYILLQSCSIYSPIAFQPTKFNELVNWVSIQKLSNTPDIQLPQQYEQFSITGKVYITGSYIFIPTWVGRHTVLPSWFSNDKDCEGYLFVKNTLSYDEPAGDMDQVTIYVPNFSGLYGINSPRGAVKSVMFVRSTINSRWYTLESPPSSVLE